MVHRIILKIQQEVKHLCVIPTASCLSTILPFDEFIGFIKPFKRQHTKFIKVITRDSKLVFEEDSDSNSQLIIPAETNRITKNYSFRVSLASLSKLKILKKFNTNPELYIALNKEKSYPGGLLFVLRTQKIYIYIDFNIQKEYL